jgi:hypothetical protein
MNKLQRSYLNGLFKAGTVYALALFTTLNASAQSDIPLTDLSSFKTPGKSWQITGDVSADISKNNTLTTSPGTGVLVNIPGPQTQGIDLYTVAEHGDADIELNFMMARGSNSGIYLQGRYEIQLLDSWTVKTAGSGDNGGIYERWMDSKPEGQKGYEGHAPRQNASKAPGLWQHMRISFQAPRFDGQGQKTENARILRIDLNGVTIHENVELSGPTRGAMNNQEATKGPLRFQGDHGAVAFKNIRITSFDRPRPEFKDVRYTVFKGRYQENADFTKLPPEAQGTLPIISASTINKVPGEYFIRYTGTVKVTEPGSYSFNMYVPGGRGIMTINKQPLQAGGRNQRSSINLQPGEYPFEILYTKTQDWTNRSLALGISGPGIREYIIGDMLAAGGQGNADPILVDAPVNTLLRSFMDLPGGPRVVHAVNVGSPAQVHYTYDMDNGNIIQAWRGGFLDATPMWYSRGDGSSRPVGAVQRFGKPSLTLVRLAAADGQWLTDTSGTGFFAKGYKVDKSNTPSFRYLIYNTQVEDVIRVMDNGEGLRREISVQTPVSGLYARLAEAENISEVSNGLYVIQNKSYYIRIDNAGNSKPVIRDSNGRKELIIPVESKISYAILF